MFEAWYLVDLEAGPARPDVDQGLDFEALAIRGDEGQAASPEGVVAVAQVAVLAAPDPVDDLCQYPVADPAEHRDVGAAATGDEAAALGEVGSGQQGGYEAGYLCWVARPVAVEHYNDVTRGGPEPRRQGVTFALAGLGNHL